MINENAMVGCINTRAQKTSTMAFNLRITSIPFFHKMTMYFLIQADMRNYLR